MKRRDLLKLLAAAPLGLVAAELLLPKRTFFLPPAGGWRAGQFDLINWMPAHSNSGAPGLYVVGDSTTEIWTDYDILWGGMQVLGLS